MDSFFSHYFLLKSYKRVTQYSFPFLFNYLSRANSAGPSAGIQEQKRPKITIWPEWSDADVNAEKWVRSLHLVGHMCALC